MPRLRGGIRVARWSHPFATAPTTSATRRAVDALRRIWRGGAAMDPVVVSQLLGRARSDDPLASLTERERAVLELMADGGSNAGIGRKLFPSPSRDARARDLHEADPRPCARRPPPRTRGACAPARLTCTRGRHRNHGTTVTSLSTRQAGAPPGWARRSPPASGTEGDGERRKETPMTRPHTIPRTRRARAAAALAVAAVLAGIVTALATAAPPSNTAAPTVSGTAREGETLTAANGTWANDPTSFSYQWQRCNADRTGCAAISGATNKSYTLASADTDHRVRVLVTASNADGQSSSTSATSGVVSGTGAPVNSAKPSISGTPTVGEELSASNGTWSGGARTFSYQWQRCDSTGSGCVNVVDATSRVYGVRSADVGHAMRVVVTARNESGSRGTPPPHPAAARPPPRGATGGGAAAPAKP